jgi:hypothetical protein
LAGDLFFADGPFFTGNTTMFTPKRLFKITATISLLVVIGLSVYGLNYLKRLGPMPAGYVSQTLCSGLFIAERDYDDIYANDITDLQRRLTQTQVEGNIISTKFGFWPFSYVSNMAYRPGLGCARLAQGSINDLEGPAFLERDIAPLSSQDLA